MLVKVRSVRVMTFLASLTMDLIVCFLDEAIPPEAGFMGKNVFYSKRVDVVTKAKTF